MCTGYYSCRACHTKISRVAGAIHKPEHWLRTFPYRRARHDIITSEGKEVKGLAERKVPELYGWEHQPWEDDYEMLRVHLAQFHDSASINRAIVASLATAASNFGVSPPVAAKTAAGAASSSSSSSSSGAKTAPATVPVSPKPKKATPLPSPKQELKAKAEAKKAPAKVETKVEEPAVAPVSPSSVTRALSLVSDDETPLFAGYLQKRAGGRQLADRWQKRWFVLFPGTIDYYETKEKATDRKNMRKQPIYLASITKPPTPVHFKGRPWSIYIPTFRRTYELEAATEKEQKEWLRRISEALERLPRPTPTAASGAGAGAATPAKK